MPEDLFNFQGQQAGGPGVPFTSLPQDIQNAANQADINWANADQKYYSAREQQIGPLIGAILSIGGGVLAPLLGPMLAGTEIGGGLSNLAASALIGGGSGTLGGLISGEPFGQALEGGALSAAGQFAGGELGSALHGLAGGAGAFGSGAGDLIGAAGGGLGGAIGDAAGSLAGSLGGAAGSGLGSTVSELLVNGALNPSALSQILGGAGGAAGAFGGGAGTTPMGGSTFGAEFDNTPAPTGLGPGYVDYNPSGGAFGGAPNNSQDPTVSELTVTAAPQATPGLNPLSIPDIPAGSLTNPQPFQPANDQGKPDINKLINDISQLLSGGGGGALGGIIHSTPAGGGTPGGGTPAGGGTPGSGTPAGVGGPGGGIPSIPGIGGLGGVGSPTPSLANVGPAGGTGAGPGGPGGFDLKGSLAPDIYPWSSGGGM